MVFRHTALVHHGVPAHGAGAQCWCIRRPIHKSGVNVDIPPNLIQLGEGGEGRLLVLVLVLVYWCWCKSTPV